MKMYELFKERQNNNLMSKRLKKLIFIFAMLSMLCIMNCDEDPYFYNTAINQSNEVVTAKFYVGKSTEDITLNPGDIKEIKLLKGTYNREYGVKHYSPDKKVSVSKSKSEYIFKDRQSYKIKILNLTGKTGVLSETDSWMDNIDFTESDGVQENNNWLIYTSNPKFKVTFENNFSFMVSTYEFNDGVFYITVN